MLQSFLLSILTASLISYFTTPLVRNYFINQGWIEDPKKKHQKSKNATATTAVPRGGGLPIYFALLVTSLLFLPADKHLLGILIASLFTLIIGLWDDLSDISPRLRLVTNLISALIIVSSGIGIAYISNPFGGIINLSTPQINFNFFGNHTIWLLSDLLAIFWIIWCSNIVGWSGGIEGQLPGFVSVAAIFIGLLGLRFGSDATQWPVIILAGATAGAYLGFFPYNFPPQSIMPGYSGKSLAGLLLAVLSILSGAKLATLALILFIPMLDAVFVLLKRLITKKPLLTSEPGHLHHHLLARGWSRKQITLFYLFATLIFGFITLSLNSQQKFYVFFGLSLLLLSFFVKFFRRN